MKNRIRWQFLLLLVLPAIAGFGQGTVPVSEKPESLESTKTAKNEANDNAKKTLKKLHQGTLVVRLSTGTSKAKALQKLIDSPNVEEKDRRRYQAMLEKSMKEVRSQNQGLIAAFRNQYSFSKIMFMPDTSATQFKNGTRQGIFLNDNMEFDPSLSLVGDCMVAFYGTSLSDMNTNNEGINIVDQHLQPIPYPFPAFVGRTSIRRIFEEIFNKSNGGAHFEKLVAKFQKKLEEF